LEDQFPARVVDEGDDGHDGFSGEVLVLGKPDGNGDLGLRGTGAQPHGGEQFETPLGHDHGT
jgi:hypothetical protein